MLVWMGSNLPETTFLGILLFACPYMINWVIIISNSPFLPANDEKEGDESVISSVIIGKGIRS